MIIVDGIHPRGWMLSHWKGAEIPPGCAADTSAGIVLLALKNNLPQLRQEFVTATHFDIDGFIGVWSLFYPEVALRYAELLETIATLGDFRHVPPKHKWFDTALKITAWINAEERNHFYVPFESEDEMENCAPKFAWFLPRFEDVLQHPDAYRSVWEPEYLRVKEDLQKITQVIHWQDVGASVVHASEPVHYYALFAKTYPSDLVISVYPEQRYEVEMKYTTWVNLASRPSFPRIQLSALADKLNSSEDTSWNVEKITDTGPLLRIENRKLTRAERYAHPYERTIASSSLRESTFLQYVKTYLNRGYQGIKPGYDWSWEKVRKVPFNVQLK